MAQTHRFRIGTKAPISHSIGYEYEFKNQLSTGIDVGVLTSPYGEIFNAMMDRWGMSEAMRNLLDDTFTYAWVVQPNVGYNINEKWRVEVVGQYLYSSTSTPPTNSFIEFFGSSLDQSIIDQFALTSDLQIIGRLYQVGAQVERRFQLKNPKWEFRLGLGLSSNIQSENVIDIKQTGSIQIAPEALDLIITETNLEIKRNYLKYAHIPTLSCTFVRKLGKE